MSLEEQPTVLRAGELAAIHATLTTLSVAVGRLEVQMTAGREEVIATRRGLEHHTANEHRSFDEALEVVSDIRISVNKLLALEPRLAALEPRMVAVETVVSQQRGAWFALAKVAAIITGTAGLLALLWGVITGAPK